MQFLLGVHQPHWLERTGVPLFVSHARLRDRDALPRALGPWALDSGGFSELSKHGTWTISEEEYLHAVVDYMDRIGNLQWAAVQDWMCEPHIIAKTGLSVRVHQERTVTSYLRLTAAAPTVQWAPVIQGFKRAEYHAHVAMYRAAGVDLAALPIVGVGSICRRQATAEAADIIESIADLGIRIHAFGLKTLGLPRVARSIVSSDSMAWSMAARRSPPLPGCRHGVPGKPRKDGRPGNCANCLRYALQWRDSVINASRPAPAWQLDLFHQEAA